MANTKTRRGRNTTTVERELPTDDEALLTKDEVAAWLGVKWKWVERAVESGVLPHHKIGRLVRIRRGDVRAYIEAQRKVGR